MADRYIDHDETQIYGPYTIEKIKTRVVGLQPPFDEGLLYVAGELAKSTKSVANAVEQAREKDAKLRQGTRVKKSALKNGIATLGRFSRHLDGHAPGKVDRRIFFPEDGTATGAGRSAHRVLRTLGRIAGKLRAKDSPVRDSENWAKQLSAAAVELAPVIAFSDSAKTDRREVTPEVETARAEWLLVYGSAKLVVEGVLRLSGKADLMPRIFFDLAVPAGAKIVEPPSDANDDEPADDDEPEPAPPNPS